MKRIVSRIDEHLDMIPLMKDRFKEGLNNQIQSVEEHKIRVQEQKEINKIEMNNSK